MKRQLVLILIPIALALSGCESLLSNIGGLDLSACAGNLLVCTELFWDNIPDSANDEPI